MFALERTKVVKGPAPTQQQKCGLISLVVGGEVKEWCGGGRGGMGNQVTKQRERGRGETEKYCSDPQQV